MITTYSPDHTGTAGDVMTRAPVEIPRQMLVRNAACLRHRARVSEAPVVDGDGSCVMLLSPADIFRWVDAGCPASVVGPVATCPYQVSGRLFTGEEAVICPLASESCPYQVVQPTTGGRHTNLCTRTGNEPWPFGTGTAYMRTEGITRGAAARSGAADGRARAGRLVVLDESDRSIGIVSATDVLTALAKGLMHEP